jgi:hypothetical protein
MERQSNDLYDRISGLRGEALDALGTLARADLAMTSDEVGRLVVAMQRVTNQLGCAQALLMRPPAAPAGPAGARPV